MKRWLGSLIVAIFVSVSGFAAGARPQVVSFGQKISINVKDMTLGQLLRLWDQATGMQSSIPRELANRTVSLSFSGLSFDDAVRKIFEKLALDYVFIASQGIIVTAVSRAGTVAEPAPVSEDMPQVPDQVSEPELPQSQPMALPPQPPPVIQTPFGPIPKSEGIALIHLPPIPGETPGPPFFAPQVLPPPPAGAPNGPVQNNLFGPISIYQNPSVALLTPQAK
jgi:hypothetical protein